MGYASRAMVLYAKVTTFRPEEASFRTHLNYAKYLEQQLAGNKISISVQKGERNVQEVERYMRLHEPTHRSIFHDHGYTMENAAYGEVIAPWLPVKCHYSLYYLESILCHLLDGSVVGFRQGGHGNIRRHLSRAVQSGIIQFSNQTLNEVRSLKDVRQYPSIKPGENARSEFWRDPKCTEALARKIVDYKLADAQGSARWNLLKPSHRKDREEYIDREKIMLLDFFYWYRLRANYRDLDYINFDGISPNEIQEYVHTYFMSYAFYKIQLRLAIAAAKKSLGF